MPRALAVMVVAMVGAGLPAASAHSQTGATPPPATETTTAAQTGEPASRATNDRYVEEILQRIGERRTQPAGDVFKNVTIPWLKTTAAEDFLTIMNLGYARALGVTCTHCHVEGDFASDDKRPKQAAREMAVMHRMINQELGKMKHLRGSPDERAINCAACHRGTLDPTDAH